MVAVCPALDAIVVRLGNTPEPQPIPAHLPVWRKRSLRHAGVRLPAEVSSRASQAGAAPCSAARSASRSRSSWRATSTAIMILFMS